VVCGDGAAGHPALAPYDRLIATVGVWDLAPAWLEQLRPDGRLVVPLDLRGVQVSVAMERADGHWASGPVAPCGFMRMRGPDAGPEVLRVLRRDPELMLGLPGPREIGDVLAALGAVPTEIATGVGEPAPGRVIGMGVPLWLALYEPRWCVLSGQTPAGPQITAGIVDGDGIAVLAAEGVLVARGHGDGGARLAADLAGHVAAWDEAGRPEVADLRVTAYPGQAAAGPAEGIVIRKRHTTLVVSFR
jgi:protein-L-isoaspartate(D-aspartate) O-methyltransferase